ncbi:MAG TPA: cobalamin biosynthesis protein CbiN [Methanoregulaceae archaeon]|nr:cobalamin biosynthesis protein CbiN [Methanoregulaceae archaeon]
MKVNYQLIAVGAALALVVGVAAVFLASSDPDGLDSTALITQGQKELTAPANPDAEIDEAILPGSFAYSAPFPDYTLEGAGKLTDVALMAGGILVALAVVLGLGFGIKAFSRAGAP